jgi:hypothetical protein
MFENYEEKLPHSFRRVKMVAAAKKIMEIATQKCYNQYIGKSFSPF